MESLTSIFPVNDKVLSVLGYWRVTSIENRDGEILFCTGIPGAGKTYLASFVIDDLRTIPVPNGRTVGVAWTYCNYTERGSQNTVSLISSLLRQLVKNLTDIPSEISDLFDTHSRGIMPLIMAEIKQALLAVAKPYDQAFIVVDALDECEESYGTRDAFTKELLVLPLKLQLLVTCRPNEDTREDFQHGAHKEILLTTKTSRTMSSCNSGKKSSWQRSYKTMQI